MKIENNLFFFQGPTPWDLKLDEETRKTEALESVIPKTYVSDFILTKLSGLYFTEE